MLIPCTINMALGDSFEAIRMLPLDICFDVADVELGTWTVIS
jgi:hypothetical protein